MNRELRGLAFGLMAQSKKCRRCIVPVTYRVAAAVVEQLSQEFEIKAIEMNSFVHSHRLKPYFHGFVTDKGGRVHARHVEI